MRRRGVIRRFGGLCLLLWLSGCVTTPPGPESRELTLAAEADRVLHAGLAVLVGDGGEAPAQPAAAEESSCCAPKAVTVPLVTGGDSCCSSDSGCC